MPDCAGCCQMTQSGKVPRVGAELVSATIDFAGELRKSSGRRAAKCDAVEPGLPEVVAAWDRLPAPIREAIGVMVRSASSTPPESRPGSSYLFDVLT